MLKTFEVTGFKSLKEHIILEFSGSDKLMIQGKNSTGKTNLGLALFDIVSHLTSKYISAELYDYYLNSDSPHNHAAFRYLFIFGENEIDYSYRKDEKQSLVFERLSLNKKNAFHI